MTSTAPTAPPAARPLSILHTEASKGWGGQEIRILTEAAGMIRRGHRVQLACPPDARIYSEAPRFGVPVVALPIGKKRPGGVFALRPLLAEGWDVVNTHSSTDSWLAALANVTLKHPPALVRTRHISAAVPNNTTTRWLYGTASTHIVTTGEALRQQLVRDNGLPPERLTSIPTGIDPQRYFPGDRAAARAELKLPADARLVGIVATLRSWKGHRYLIEALAAINDPQVQLLIAGDGPQREALEAQVKELGLTGRVHFAGNQADVAPWLRACDLFALPSYANEGVPQALLQAMMTGLAAVTTDAGAIGEIARHEETALVVPKQDAAALRAALERLLADPPLAERLGTAARRLVLAEHSLDTMLDRMEAVFRDAAAQRDPQRQ